MPDYIAGDAQGKRLRDVRRGPALKGGRGGEGTVYEDADRPELVIKIFHQPTDETRDKLRAMLARPPAHQVEHHGGKAIVQIAWPREMLFKPSGAFVGYSMHRVDFSATVPLNAWFSSLSRKDNRLDPNDYVRFYIALNLAAVVRYVHQVGHAVIDIKPENIRAYRKDGFVCLIDCDGFRIRDGATVYPAQMATQPYTAPEHHQGPWTPNTFDEAQDRFGLAVMIFLLLNNGWHPSTGTLDSAPSDTAGRVKEGLFFIDPSTGLVPPRASHHAFWPDDTRDLFRLAFTTSRRPSADQWRQHLHRLATSRQRCSNDIHHWHFGLGCPWCNCPTRVPLQTPAPGPASAPNSPAASAAPVSGGPPYPHRPYVPLAQPVAQPAAVPSAAPRRSTATRARSAKPPSRWPVWVRLSGGVLLTVGGVSAINRVIENRNQLAEDRPAQAPSIAVPLGSDNAKPARVPVAPRPSSLAKLAPAPPAVPRPWRGDAAPHDETLHIVSAPVSPPAPAPAPTGIVMPAPIRVLPPAPRPPPAPVEVHTALPERAAIAAAAPPAPPTARAAFPDGPDPLSQTWLDRAEEAYAQGDVGRAKEFARNALRYDPSSQRAMALARGARAAEQEKLRGIEVR